MHAAARIPCSRSKISVHRTVESFRAMRRNVDLTTSIGFVPTMGALHEAKASNSMVVASIFVNPTQFGPNEDLDKYPRQIERDLDLLEDMGVDHVFTPDSNTMYGPHHTTFVDPQGFDDTREGLQRPGHFRGVATIVAKLLNIVQPTRAYFGQKDATQCAMIRRMVEDMNMDVTIQVESTVREQDGLAMSSRNAYLTPEERAAAPILYQSLEAARAMLHGLDHADDIVSAQTLEEMVRTKLSLEPLVSHVQYVAIDDRLTMRPLASVRKGDGAIVSIACKIGNVRLIDNVILQ